MQKLFFPESIVVFGVSPVQSNLAKYIVMNLRNFGYTGKIHCVGRDSGEVFGSKIHKNINDVGCTPDLAVFLIPAKAVPNAVEACGNAGIRRCVVESGGFSEFADSGKSLEKDLLDIAARSGMRFVGPNCIGIVNLENGMTLPFVPMDASNVKKGPVSVLAQSGGVIVDFTRLFELENIGFSKMVSMGNKLNINESDLLEYLVDDPATKIIVMHLESISNGEKLLDIAGRTSKPIIMVKANNSPAGREIARFHTSALAGDDEIASAAFRQAGIHRLPNLKEAMEFIKVLSLPLLKGPNLAILCRSGGQAVILADAAYKHGFERARLTPEFYAMVQKECRAGVIRATNPLDLGDIFDFDAYIKIVEGAISQEGVDGVLLYHGYLGAFELETTKRLIRACHEISVRYGKPVMMFMISDRDNWFSFKSMTDLPIFSDPDAAMKALALSLQHHKRTQSPAPVEIRYAKRPRAVQGGTPRPLNALSVFKLLEQYGLPVVPYAVTDKASDCLEAAGRIGYPVALKMGAAEILHKTEQKGVVLNIGSAGKLKKEFTAMQKKQGGGELVLQKMASAGHELIIGGKRDREFGPVVVFGLGGILVELLKDAAMRIAPVSEQQALEMVREIKGSRLLEGFRGRPPADTEALADYIRKVSLLISEHPEIAGIDINPLVLFEKGDGGLIIDAKIEAIEG